VIQQACGAAKHSNRASRAEPNGPFLASIELIAQDEETARQHFVSPAPDRVTVQGGTARVRRKD